MIALSQNQRTPLLKAAYYCTPIVGQIDHICPAIGVQFGFTGGCLFVLLNDFRQRCNLYASLFQRVMNAVLVLGDTNSCLSRVNAKGYFDSEDTSDARYEKKKVLNAQRITDYKNGSYELGGGVVDPLPEDAPFFVKDYHDYYKTSRGYHSRSLNSNGGWNKTGCMSFLNQPILAEEKKRRSNIEYDETGVRTRYTVKIKINHEDGGE